MCTKWLLPLLLAACVVCAPPSDAQCRLCTTPSTTSAETSTNDDVRIEIESNLDFDRLIVSKQGAGEATVRPDGSTGSSGSVDLGPRVKVATVVVHGQAGRTLRIDIPRRIELFSLEGGRLTFDEVTTDAADLPRLDSAGNLTFHIGGRLRFVGTEDGNFRGDLPITVDYL